MSLHRIAFIAILSAPFLAIAEPPDGERGDRRGPPPEAIDACLDLVELDACSFSHRDREMVGTCQPGPEPELPLACRPDDAPPHR